MSKIHITLVGGQVYPAYLGILLEKPDKVILVHSDKTSQEAQRIKEIVPIPTTLREMSPVDEDIFRQTAAIEAQIESDYAVSINLTGGTKLWSIAFYDAFRDRKNVRLIYIDQNSRVYDLANQTSYFPEGVELDMDTVFKLNGIHPGKVKSTPISDYTEEDADDCRKIEQLRKKNWKTFNDLTLLTKEDRNELNARTEGRWRHESGGMLEWNKRLGEINMRLYDYRGRFCEDAFTSPHAFTLLFNAGWFEYKVARTLSNWQYAKEIRMNVVFPYTGKDNPKNEIDIIVNTGVRLLFVECKTQIQDKTHIDKFNTAVKNYGGLASKALFVTDAPMQQEAREKCTDSGIVPFSFQDSRNNKENPEEVLFRLLEKELFSINKK